MTCPTALVWPVWMKLRRRNSSGESPAAAATRSMWRSSAKRLCGAPNPRNAPCGGAFVATARPRTRTFGQKYGPGAWIVPRDRTTGVSVQYAPPSIVKSMSIATSRPSFVMPVRWRVLDGCRLVVATMSSARSYTIFTGRSDFHASSAAWPARIEGYSSLPPNPPPVSIWTTRIFSPGRLKSAASALWM